MTARNKHELQADSELSAKLVPLDQIVVRTEHRDVDHDALTALIGSIREVGLLSPIIVIPKGEGGPVFELVSGRHRLEAYRAILADCADEDDAAVYGCIAAVVQPWYSRPVESRLCEIAENLHRSDLTVQERAAQMVEWLRLVDVKRAEEDAEQKAYAVDKAAQVAPPSNVQPHDKGIKAAVRFLGVERTAVQRAIKIASTTPDAAAAAKEVGLDDNQSALLKIASAPADQQVAKVAELAAKPHRTLATGDNEWFTPLKYIDLARDVLGAIDLDPASNEIAQETVKATTFYTKESDGLAHCWTGRVWLNPPYAQPLIRHFADKLVAEVANGNVPAALVLVNNSTETGWFQTLLRASRAICFPASRIRFVSPSGKSESPLQGQAFFYFGPDAARFAEVFGTIGEIVEYRKPAHALHVAANDDFKPVEFLRRDAA
jgi:phage N-6-adenine-methyltransferase